MLQVMIVDDADIARKEIRRLKLWGEKTGFVISGEAKNGHEALEKLRISPVDMVITDIRMPKVDGIELLKEIMEKKLCPCVILLSDHCEFKYARDGLILGAFDYISKPVEEEVLIGLLQRAKDYILGERQERERIRQLEKTLEEKSGVSFPQYEVRKLADAAKAGDRRAIEYAEHTAGIVLADAGKDLIKAESLLNRILDEVKNEIMKSNKWLDKFVSMEEIGEIEISGAGEPDTIKSVFVKGIERMVDILGTLRYASKDKGIVEQVCNYVLDNIDEGITLTTAADKLFLSKQYISGVFKQKTALSFVEYLTSIKMERAKKLLRDGELRIYEIAELLDFKDIEYFSRLFKKHTGLSPTEYRQNMPNR